jgi:hypothetical protein
MVACDVSRYPEILALPGLAVNQNNATYEGVVTCDRRRHQGIPGHLSPSQRRVVPLCRCGAPPLRFCEFRFLFRGTFWRNTMGDSSDDRGPGTG